MAHEDSIKGLKKVLEQIMDMILKYLPNQNTLYYKEQLVKLESQNADLKEELANAAANALSDNISHFTFEDMAKQVSSHFADVGDRIANGDRDYKDLLEYCDVDKMLEDAKQKLIYNNKAEIPQTLTEILKSEKPGIAFDETNKVDIANELVARGHIKLIDYFQANDYLQVCLDGKVDLGVKICGSVQKGVFVHPDYDETLGLNLAKTITHCEEYLGDTIRAGGDYYSALEDCKATVKEELYRIYLDRNIQFEDVFITQDNIFMYGDMEITYPVNGKITFTYDKETQNLDLQFDGLDKELTELQIDAIHTKAYDVIDMQIEKDEYERKANQERQEQEELEEDDPYSERTLFY